MKYEEGDLVLCVVDRIVGTVVFVKIENNGEGSIITAEIAPGRIRNLRDYVFPKKKIVCKILKIDSSGNIHLSLRRVKENEKRKVLEEHNQENSVISIIKSITKEKSEEIIEKIKKQSTILDFLQKAKENPKILEEIVGKQNSERILGIFGKQKSKKAIIKKEFVLKTSAPNGIELIKKILLEIQNTKIKYLSAGRYSIEIESSDLKKADNELNEILKKIEQQAKTHSIEFAIKGK